MAIDAAHVELATKIDALEGKLIYGPRTYYSEHITRQHQMLWFENPFDMLKAPRGLAGLTTLSPVDAARPATVRPFDRLRVPLG